MTVTFGEKKGKKTEIFIDGEYKGSLYPGEIDEYGLKDGGETGPEEVSKMMEETLLKRAKRYVMEILVKADKTEAELMRKLSEKGYSSETAGKAIDYVRGFHYIDELRTAQNFIRSHIQNSSEKEIRYKLSLKGVNEETVDMAYQCVCEEEETENPELEAAKNFVKKKLNRTIEDEDELSYEEKQKLFAAAFRKGFRTESIRAALKN